MEKTVIRKGKPEELAVKTLRSLCKEIVGRTSPSPLATINKYLREHSDRYVLRISGYSKVGTGYSGYLNLETKGIQDEKLRQKSLTVPLRIKDFIATVLAMDAQAEKDFGLCYGGEWRTGAQAQSSESW